jgi:hypothetical protein
VGGLIGVTNGKQGEDKNILPLPSFMHPFLGFRIYCLQEISNVGFMGMSSFLLSRLFACCICYFGGQSCFCSIHPMIKGLLVQAYMGIYQCR